MKRRGRAFTLLFSIPGGMLLLFLALPLGSLLFGTPLSRLGAALSDPEILHSLSLTFLAALLASGLGLLGGAPLAYLLARRRFPGKHLLEALIDLPIIIPHTAAGIALLMVFGSRGLLGAPFAAVGVFFTDRLAGVVVAMLFVGAPYLVNMSREAFALIDVELEATALVEGATPWQAFHLVSLPLAWRGIMSGAMMMWARGISEFGAVAILAYHPKIAPTLIYELFQGFGLTAAQPAAALLILISIGIFAVLRGVLMRSDAAE